MTFLDCQQYSHKDITFVNIDCLTGLKTMPDKSVALARSTSTTASSTDTDVVQEEAILLPNGLGAQLAGLWVRPLPYTVLLV